MWIAYAMTMLGEADDSVKTQLDDCDRVRAKHKTDHDQMRPFIDREPAGTFFDGGRPYLADAITFARAHSASRFVVATLERLSENAIDRSLIIAQLLAAGVEGLYTPREGRIDPFPIIRGEQEVIRKRLADVEQLRASIAELEHAKESLRKTLSERRDVIQRRKEQIRALRGEPSSLAMSLLSAIRLCGLSINAIAKAAGVPQPVLHRFVKGERGISLKTAEKVFKVLEVRVPPVS